MLYLFESGTCCQDCFTYAVLRRSYVVIVVEKVPIIDAYAHRIYKTRNRKFCIKPAKKNDQFTDTVDSNATPMLLTSGERILLQIATVSIQRVDGSTTVITRVLLDSASQRTFMTDHLAKQLKLVPEHRESLSVSTPLYFWSGETHDQ